MYGKESVVLLLPRNEMRRVPPSQLDCRGLRVSFTILGSIADEASRAQRSMENSFWSRIESLCYCEFASFRFICCRSALAKIVRNFRPFVFRRIFFTEWNPNKLQHLATCPFQISLRIAWFSFSSTCAEAVSTAGRSKKSACIFEEGWGLWQIGLAFSLPPQCLLWNQANGECSCSLLSFLFFFLFVKEF